TSRTTRAAVPDDASAAAPTAAAGVAAALPAGKGRHQGACASQSAEASVHQTSPSQKGFMPRARGRMLGETARSRQPLQNIREDPARFVEWFRHSAPYVHAHRDRTFVLVFGGQTVASEGFRRLVSDVALLAGVGVKLVLVHGAQPQTVAHMQAVGARVRKV